MVSNDILNLSERQTSDLLCPSVEPGIVYISKKIFLVISAKKVGGPAVNFRMRTTLSMNMPTQYGRT